MLFKSCIFYALEFTHDFLILELKIRKLESYFIQLYLSRFGDLSNDILRNVQLCLNFQNTCLMQPDMFRMLFNIQRFLKLSVIKMIQNLCLDI